jgi:putative lipoprotein
MLKSLSKTLITVSALAGAAFMTACSSQSEGEGMKAIETVVMYRERMALPPNAELTVSFSDVAKMDVAAELISEVKLAAPGNPPYEVSLPYESAQINDRGRYSARAVITVDGRLLFTTTMANDVFAPNEDGKTVLMMQRVNSRAKANAPMAGGTMTPNAALTNTYWKLMTLNGEPAKLGANDKEVYFQMMEQDNAVRGFGGCNRYKGSYSFDENGLNLSPLASTMMACPEGMELEQQYHQALASMTSVAVDGETLTMKNEAGDVVATFESRYMQ